MNGSMGGGEKNYAKPAPFFGGGGGGGPSLLRKKIAIIGGPFKGYLGTVKEVSGTSARVELDSKGKIVIVDLSKLQLREFVLVFWKTCAIVGPRHRRRILPPPPLIHSIALWVAQLQ